MFRVSITGSIDCTLSVQGNTLEKPTMDRTVTSTSNGASKQLEQPKQVSSTATPISSNVSPSSAKIVGSKVSVVGVGQVGMACAYSMMIEVNNLSYFMNFSG